MFFCLWHLYFWYQVYLPSACLSHSPFSPLVHRPGPQSQAKPPAQQQPIDWRRSTCFWLFFPSKKWQVAWFYFNFVFILWIVKNIEKFDQQHCSMMVLSNKPISWCFLKFSGAHRSPGRKEQELLEQKATKTALAVFKWWFLRLVMFKNEAKSLSRNFIVRSKYIVLFVLIDLYNNGPLGPTCYSSWPWCSCMALLITWQVKISFSHRIIVLAIIERRSPKWVQKMYPKLFGVFVMYLVAPVEPKWFLEPFISRK